MSDPRSPEILTSGLHCDHRSFFKMGLVAQEKCHLIAQAECHSDYFNYYEFYYCYVKMPWMILLVNLVLFVCYRDSSIFCSTTTFCRLQV
jgi:hypothetical protein